jgi:hypothetical protein
VSMCPVCSPAVESVGRFLLDCPAYSQVRADASCRTLLGRPKWQAAAAG